MNGFSTPLDVRRLDGDKWEVLSPFICYLDTSAWGDAYEYVEVHKGFITDFASIPFPFSRVFLPIGKSYDKASVVHDFLYWLPVVWTMYGNRTITRKEADSIYLDMMEKSGTPIVVRQSIYTGVRAGGSRTWNKYRSENKLV